MTDMERVSDTLSVALNLGDQRLVGFVSSAKDWYPVRGTFQVMR
jgi:hypothetical protein